MPSDIERAAERLLEAACGRELMLVTAESCTGGLLASLLTDVSGKGHAFDRGFVTYTNDAKHELLGVSRSLLETPGPVSEPVARAMAEGALARSGGHLAAAVTGFAGPCGPDEEEGLVHFAVARRDGPTLHREAHFGAKGRGPVRIDCLRTAVDMLNEALA